MIVPAVRTCGLLSALGNLEQTWQGLLDLRTGLAPLDHPEITTSVGQIAQLQAPLGSAERLKELLTLGFADLAPNQLDPQTQIIVATTKGAIDDLSQQNPQLQSWQIADHIKQHLHLHGETATTSAACASGTIAIMQACQKICAKETASVLVVGVDILSMFVLAGFSQLLALSETGCKPFDTDRNGLSLGEGMGYMHIVHPDKAAKEDVRITGWGISGDAGHITAPCRKGSGLIRVFRQIIAQGQQVGGINGHGTGTIYNDAMEITAMNHFFNTPPPFHSVKGAIGHCLGGAGVMEGCLSIQSLHHGKLPATIGLRNVDTRTEMASGDMEQELHYPTVLSCNSGFGGINAGVLFGKREGE